MMTEPEYNEVLLEDITWSFSEPVATNLDNFIKALEKYGSEMDFEPSITDISTPLYFKNAKVIYRYYVEKETDGDSEWVEKSETIPIASEGSTLTEVEMLYLTHQAVHKVLSQQDAHYFEGLELVGTDQNGPIYEIILGS